MEDWIALAGFVAACFAAASSGAFFRPGDWYRGLRKPAWTPPNWLFAPAWTLLYILIAVSGWLVWRKTGLAGAPAAFAAYVLQLVLNAGWSAIFFGMRRPDLALFEVVALWIAIALTIVTFGQVEPFAALLLVPYLAWVTFAAALNLSVWRLNRAAA
jgi:tryptophan-rich sensory protein